jgi:hypothetical protein
MWPAAGVLYWALVFAVGFGVGVVRTLLLEPLVGHETAVYIELPLMVLVCAVAARAACHFLAPQATRFQAVLIGLIGLVLLIGSEAAVGYFLLDQTLETQLLAYLQPAGFAAMVAYAIYAAGPVVFVRR